MLETHWKRSRRSWERECIQIVYVENRSFPVLKCRHHRHHHQVGINATLGDISETMRSTRKLPPPTCAFSLNLEAATTITRLSGDRFRGRAGP